MGKGWAHNLIFLLPQCYGSDLPLGNGLRKEGIALSTLNGSSLGKRYEERAIS